MCAEVTLFHFWVVQSLYILISRDIGFCLLGNYKPNPEEKKEIIRHISEIRGAVHSPSTSFLLPKHLRLCRNMQYL
jgi:hypothetical protein